MITSTEAHRRFIIVFSILTFVIYGFIFYFILFVYVPDKQKEKLEAEKEVEIGKTMIDKSPIIGSVTTVGTRDLILSDYELFDTSPLVENKTSKIIKERDYINQSGKCTFISFVPVIDGAQLLTFTYTISLGQRIQLGSKTYKFFGYQNGEFKFEEI